MVETALLFEFIPEYKGVKTPYIRMLRCSYFIEMKIVLSNIKTYNFFF